jgi:hypothetical protein
MNRFRAIFEQLPLEAMSGDETDHRGPDRRYNITTLSWRSPAIRAWMQVLDDLHLSTRFTQGKRTTAGKFPHARVQALGRNERHLDVPVKGLPSNFYNPDWLSSLDDYDRKDLRIQPAVDLTFTSGILR